MEQPQNHQTATIRGRNREALTGFNSLPDDAHVRRPVLCALFACSPRTISNRVKAGLIPQPVKHGRIAMWRVGDIRRALRGEAA